MTFNVLIRFKYLCSELIKPVVQFQEEKIVLEQHTDIWTIILTMAMILVGAAALLVAISQRKDSLRAYRIAILSLLLEQLSRVYSNGSISENKVWLDAIKSVLAKWVPKEVKIIQEEIESKSK